MQVVVLAFLVSGASAATLKGAATLKASTQQMTVPPGERIPISLEQMADVINVESAVIPAADGEANAEPTPQQVAGMKNQEKMMDQWKPILDKFMPKPPEAKPYFSNEQDEKIWNAEQGHRVYMGDNSLGDFMNGVDGLKELNDKVRAKWVKKFAFKEDVEPSAVVQVASDESLPEDVAPPQPQEKPELQKLPEGVVRQIEDKPKIQERLEKAMADPEVEEAVATQSQSGETSGTAGKEGEEYGEGWDITFFVLLTVCIFVFGWWAVKVGWHIKAAEALQEFGFQCKKAISTILKGKSYDMHEDIEKSESSFEASEGTGSSSQGSRGPLNKTLQETIDRVKTNLGGAESSQAKDEEAPKHYVRKS